MAKAGTVKPDKSETKSTLVVVESPTKAKTLKKYLGPGFEVIASRGHVKDLPKKLGIDIENNFAETYQIIEGKEKILDDIKGEAKKSGKVFLATDPDREGEAIAMHIAQELKEFNRPIHRVLFHEITKRGVQDGISNPLELNDNLYEAQRSRRVLDRIVGYDVSALVWSKLAFGLSAGRVQSVALRLIVDREREVEAFVPEEYWNVGVNLLGAKKPGFLARLTGAMGEKLEIRNEETAEKVKSDLNQSNYKVAKITKKEQKRHAPAPYTTSKLQQDASNTMRFTSKRTMQVAQSLYEGVDLGKEIGQIGLITYIRTDSTRVSEDAITAVREHIKTTFGDKHLPDKPNIYKSKKGAQDAHEAIRPASLEFPPDSVKKKLKEEQYKLYKLIWDRFIASQMSFAVYDQTSVEIEATPTVKEPTFGKYQLRVTGRVLKFAGWLDQVGKGLEQQLAGENEEAEGDKGTSVASLAEETNVAQLPVLKEGEVLKRVDPPGVLAEQKFTQPPARFNEGSLVRELEKRGIGRPSTYAEIINKVQSRTYVEKLPSGAFKPTELGMIIVDGLVASSLDFMDPGFTAKMEEELDEVEAGKQKRVSLLAKFYNRFKDQLDVSKKSKRWNPDPIDTGIECTECGKGTMQKRWSKNGWFIGCSNYPKCKNTRNLAADGSIDDQPNVIETVLDCEKCGSKLQLKKGRFGQFLGCTNYPKCDFTRQIPLGIKCPTCKTGEVIEIKSKKRGSRSFWGCSNYNAEPSCEFKLWKRPVPEACGICDAAFIILGGSKKEPALVCQAEGCTFSKTITTEQATAYTEPVIPDWLFPPKDGAAEPAEAAKPEAGTTPTAGGKGKDKSPGVQTVGA
jgi:DNA topoisomerase I